MIARRSVRGGMRALAAVALLSAVGCSREAGHVPSERAGGDELTFRDALPVALLILDKSSSMEPLLNPNDPTGRPLDPGSDPENFQAAAAKDFIRLAQFLASDPERDLFPLVGVIAFSSRAEFLDVTGGEAGLLSLRDAGVAEKLAAAIDRVERDGWHTDINAALALALERLDQLERTSGKVIRPLVLLLTDGGLRPFPGEPRNYPPSDETVPEDQRRTRSDYRQAYQKAYGKDPLPTPVAAGVPLEPKAVELDRPFVDALIPYGRLRLLDELSPSFRERGIPLCCVPLGDDARGLLARVCDLANSETTEDRFLAVDDPADLPDRFTDVITSWLGIARHVGTGTFVVDETVGAVSFIVRFRPRLKSGEAADAITTLTAPGDLAVGPDTTADAMAVIVRPGAKSKLYLVANPRPGTWTVAVRKDPRLTPPDLRVTYEYLFKSKVRMVVSGIQPSYSLNTPELNVAVSFLDVAASARKGEAVKLSLPATFQALPITGWIQREDAQRVAELSFEPLGELADKAEMKGTAAIGELEPGTYRLVVRAPRESRFKPSGPFKTGGPLTERARTYKIVVEEGVVLEDIAAGEARSRVSFGKVRKRSRVQD